MEICNWYCFISKVLILAKNCYLKVFHSIRCFAHHWFLLTTVAPCGVHLAMFSTYFYYALVVFFHLLFNVDFSPFRSDLFSLRRFVKKQNIAAFKQNCSTNYFKKNILSEYIYIRKYKYVYVCLLYLSPKYSNHRLLKLKEIQSNLSIADTCDS